MRKRQIKKNGKANWETSFAVVSPFVIIEALDYRVPIVISATREEAISARMP